MSIDPIVDELDRLRAEQMESYHFDFEAFYRDLKEQERLSPQPIHAPKEEPVGERTSSAGRYRKELIERAELDVDASARSRANGACSLGW